MDYANVVDDGETVLWEGPPRQRRIFDVQDIFMSRSRSSAPGPQRTVGPAGGVFAPLRYYLK